MISKHGLIILLIASGLAFACGSSSLEGTRIHVFMEGDATPWTSLDVRNNPEQFQFAIVADNTGGARPGVFEDAVSKLNLVQPQFVVSVGDLIQGKTEDVQEIERQWQEFDGFITKLEMPFFYVPGNHDYSNQAMADFWRKRFGIPYYHFVYRNVLFLCLNSEDDVQSPPATAILDEQYTFAEKVLRENSDVRWSFVFMHKPLWMLQETGKWKDLEKLLAKRRHTVFAGHLHHYAKYQRNNGQYFVLSTTGGGKTRRGVEFDEFDHLVWVTMSEEGPIIANLLLEGIRDEDVRTGRESHNGLLEGGSLDQVASIEEGLPAVLF